MILFIYKLLTQTIIILGELREKLGLEMIVRQDRTFKDPPHMFSMVCCDCSLTHRLYRKEGVQYMQPIRPEEYDYSWRRFTGEPAVFKHKDEW